MKRIAKFEKVSLKQFMEGFERPDAESVYNEIKLPRRATAGSAGYDFYAPYDVKLAPGETAKIPTVFPDLKGRSGGKCGSKRWYRDRGNGDQNRPVLFC